MKIRFSGKWVRSGCVGNKYWSSSLCLCALLRIINVKKCMKAFLTEKTWGEKNALVLTQNELWTHSCHFRLHENQVKVKKRLMWFRGSFDSEDFPEIVSSTALTDDDTCALYLSSHCSLFFFSAGVWPIKGCEGCDNDAIRQKLDGIFSVSNIFSLNHLLVNLFYRCQTLLASWKQAKLITKYYGSPVIIDYS